MGHEQGCAHLLGPQAPVILCVPDPLAYSLLGLEEGRRVLHWLGCPFPGLEPAWGRVGGRLPSSQAGREAGGRVRWEGAGSHDDRIVWVTRLLSLWNWLSNLGVFWQASCHGDVTVQHHPLNPPPQRRRHIFPSSLASQHLPLPWRRYCSVQSSRSLPRNRRSRRPQLCRPPPQWSFSSVPKRTGIGG